MTVRRKTPSAPPKKKTRSGKPSPSGSPPGVVDLKTIRDRYPTLEVRLVAIAPLMLDPRNAKEHPEESISAIRASLRKFGQRKPIVVTADGEVKAGNGTLVAARAEGWTQIVIAPAPTKTDDARAYALADNRTAEFAPWNETILGEELSFLASDPDYGIAVLGELGFPHAEVEGYVRGPNSLDPQYTRKIVAPIYEPKGIEPAVSELFDETKTSELVEEIAAAKLPPEVANFLRLAAQRHTIFDFHRIAEFYAHAKPETQRLFEKSALVIIDFEKAIENGFVRLTERLGKIADSEGWKDAAE